MEATGWLGTDVVKRFGFASFLYFYHDFWSLVVSDSLNMPLFDTVSFLFSLTFVLSIGYAKDFGSLCSTCKQITDHFNKVGPVLCAFKVTGVSIKWQHSLVTKWKINYMMAFIHVGVWKNCKEKFWWWKYSMGRTETLKVWDQVRASPLDWIKPSSDVHLWVYMHVKFVKGFMCVLLLPYSQSSCIVSLHCWHGLYAATSLSDSLWCFSSEIRLVEILEGLCESSSFECNHMVEEHEEHFETWWFKRSGGGNVWHYLFR